MEIEQVLENVRAQIAVLRSIRLKYPNDAQLQGMVAEGLENLTEQAIKLNELYHFRDAEDATRDSKGDGGMPG
jgi:hypothetical protein